jgi:hypothetical protein
LATFRAQAGVLAAAAVLAAGCGGDERAEERRLPPQADVAAAVTTKQTCRAGTTQRLGSDRVAYAAVVEDETSAYRFPGERPFHRFERLNVNGVPTVFAIREAVLDESCKPAWYHVQLPIKPNGVTGYVRAREVWVGKVDTRIEVDLSERRITLFRRGRPLIETSAAIGTSATPTPTGAFYVNQRLIPEDESGPFGPGAIGISAFSDILTGWAQGGPIAIHGTNQPWTIGKAASNGCLRVENSVLERMFDATLAGTPVVIRA